MSATRLRLLSVAALLLLSGCASAGDGGEAPPVTVVSHLSLEPASLNPVTQNDGNSLLVADLICDTLVDFDRHIEIVPRLATSWDVSPDGREVVFHLRSGVRWHDGHPFTAADVAFTLEKVLDPASLAAGKRVYFETVVESEAVDDHTFRVRRSEPYARAVDVWERLPIVPRHLLAGEDFLEAAWNRAPVGTGPYRFASWETGSRITLTASPDYFGGPAGIERLVFRPIQDAATRAESLLAGELDVAGLRALDRERILAAPELSRRVRFLEHDALFVWYVGWNMTGSNPFFADRRVRQAMTQSLDRDGFARDILQGSGSVATSLVHPTMWAFDHDIEPWPYDREAAAALLGEAGWTDTDGDGLRDRNGVPFAFTLLVPAGSSALIPLATIFQESLRTLGIDMQVRVVEYNIYRQERNDRNFQAMMGGWSLDPDPDCYDFWHSSQAVEGVNYAGYADPEVDDLCEQARRLTSRDERAAMYRQVQRLLHRDQPNTFIVYRRSIVGLSPRMGDVTPSPLGLWGWYPGPLLWSVDGER